MQVICSYSNLPIYKTPYLLGCDLVDLHPIFRAKRKIILSPEFIHKFVKATAFEEKKLIFLAVLNVTELVDFKVPAMPSLQVVERNFFKLHPLAEWLDHATYAYKNAVGFPNFVINHETQDLSSLSAWIESLEDIKTQLIKKDIDRDRAAWLSQKEDEIRKELGEATSLHRAFTPNLARWALDFAEMSKTDERYIKWVKILCSPLADSWVHEMDELRDIEEFFELNLPAEHPQVISVMAQIRLLIKECKRGFREFAIFGNEDEDDEGGSFTILDDELGTGANLTKHLKNIPKDEPVLKNYPSRVEYLRASAKWKLAQMQLSKPASTQVRQLVKSSVEDKIAKQELFPKQKSIGSEDI